MIHIDGPLAAIGYEFTDDFYGAVLVPLPFAALRTRIFVPVSAAKNVGPPISVHIRGSNSFRMVVTELMNQICGLRHIARGVPPFGI